MLMAVNYHLQAPLSKPQQEDNNLIKATTGTLLRENQWLLIDEPVEFEK